MTTIGSRLGESEPDAAEPLLSVRVVPRPRVGRIELDGELDASTAHLLTDAVRQVAQSEAECVELCLHDLRFLAARGLSTLLAAREFFASLGRPVTVTAASPIARRVLRLTDTDEVFGLAEVDAVATPGR
ncbi:MAG TPA: STAS domain-containing protein [Cryptosporangiaceae bacterium]|nr:STAS domain-containing protein [Cryptosporangiaceae bacterium]